MGAVEQRLAEAGIEIPEVAAPVASYVPATEHAGLVYTSGQLPMVSGTLAETGIVGEGVGTVTPQRAAELAQICAVNALAAAKSVVGEPFTVSAEVFREGHDAVGATLVLTAPDGAERHLPMTCTNPGLSRWEVEVVADREGLWHYRVEGWSHPWATWVHDAGIKIPADIDADLMREEGAIVLDRAAAQTFRDEGGRTSLRQAAAVLRDRTGHQL